MDEKAQFRKVVLYVVFTAAAVFLDDESTHETSRHLFASFDGPTGLTHRTSIKRNVADSFTTGRRTLYCDYLPN